MRIGSLDFEADDWVKPVACGFAWEDGPEALDENFVSGAATVAETLRFLAAMAGEGVTWYAHNMGKYDGLFLVDAMLDAGWQLKLTLAGGSRFIALAATPPGGEVAVQVRDSLALVPAALKSAAIDFELPGAKLFTADDYSTNPSTWAPERLREGCLQDARLVVHLVRKVRSLLEEWGGELKTTFSSSALSVVRADLEASGKTLPDFFVSTRQFPKGRQRANDYAREAYYGARVEVYRHSPVYELSEWDVNSSYPWSMTQALPWAPAYQCQGDAAYQAGHEGIFEATVRVPECELPPLPWRLRCARCEANSDECPHYRDTTMWFPTGTWRGRYPGCELRYAEECGVRVQVHGGVIYTRERPFADFVERVYREKAVAKGARRQFCKLLLNGAYGKFGERPERTDLRVFPTRGDMLAYAWEHALTPVGERCGTTERFEYPRHTNYALAAYVTAYSRILLHRALSAADRPAYCDTDSVHAARGSLPQEFVGEGLGQLKLELESCRGEYYAPKIYRIVDAAGKRHYATKGFSIKCDACRAGKAPCTCDDNFRAVISGEGLLKTRIQQLKTQLKRGKGVQALQERKRWKGKSTKRCADAAGNTRPWAVAELRRLAYRSATSPLAPQLRLPF